MKAEAEWQRSLKRYRCSEQKVYTFRAKGIDVFREKYRSFVRKIGTGSFKKRRKTAIYKVAISKESDRNVSYL